MNNTRDCRACNGAGMLPESGSEVYLRRCPYCNGSGHIHIQPTTTPENEAARLADLSVELELALGESLPIREMTKAVLDKRAPIQISLIEIAMRAYVMGRDSAHRCDVCGSQICLPVKP